MGTVFLAAAGAEALYSDMGHVGRPGSNSPLHGPFIFICCIAISGRAWMIRSQNNRSLLGVENLIPFFQDNQPPNLRYVAVIAFSGCRRRASQALIMSAFTMVPAYHLQVRYPALPGQLYIPLVNLS